MTVRQDVSTDSADSHTPRQYTAQQDNTIKLSNSNRWTANRPEPSNPYNRATRVNRVIRLRFWFSPARPGPDRTANLGVPVTVPPATVRKPPEPARTAPARPFGRLYLWWTLEHLHEQLDTYISDKKNSKKIMESNSWVHIIHTHF